MDPAATVQAVTRTLARGLLILLTFVGIGLLGLVSVGLVVLPPYLAFRFGPAEYTAALTAGGALASVVVAYYVAGPLFTTGASRLGKKYS